MTTSKRIGWVDIAKGVGIILVVLGHVYSNKLVFNWLYSFHMPLFFFLGGYVCKKRNVFEDIKKRFKTTIVPYFVLGGLVLVYWIVLERRFRYSDMGVLDSAIGLLSGQYEYLDFNVHLWFLPCFFLTGVLFNCLLNLMNKWVWIPVTLMSVIYLFVQIPSILWGGTEYLNTYCSLQLDIS